MKNFYILIFISALIACSNKNQDNAQTNLNYESNATHTGLHEQHFSAASEALPISESKVSADNEAEIKNIDQVNQISCTNQNITDWYGFNEVNAEPKCENLKNFKLISYKCDISKNAFGADKDALLLENQNKRIFAYSSAKECNEMLEIRNSNAP